jgi:hypothetical protein
LQVAPSSSDGGTEALPCGCVVGGEVVLFHASRRIEGMRRMRLVHWLLGGGWVEVVCRS